MSTDTPVVNLPARPPVLTDDAARILTRILRAASTRTESKAAA